MNIIKKIIQGILGINIASLLKGRPIQSALRAFRGAWDVDSRALARIPVKSLADILQDRQPEIKLILSKREEGSLPLEQSIALLSILVAENPKEVLEIGTYMGYTSRDMALNLPHSTIHTIDLPDTFADEGIPKDDFHLISARKVGYKFKGLPNVAQHLVDTATWDFKVGNPTFIFIDGSHTYEYCKNDSEKFLNVCPKGAVFLWHDCNNGHPGVVRFLNEWRVLGRDIVRIENTPIAYWKS